MNRSRFAFVDLETTGGDPSRDRVTEVGIVLVDDGVVTGEWSSLVAPGIAIPPAIQALTGITNAMVRDAPPFAALADEIRRQLQGRVFVAHNARFDYGFLKAEFRRIGQRLLADVLCTVRLSRRLFPEQARHGLDALVARHGLDAADRHRALGDARLIARFYVEVARERHAAALELALSQLLKRTALPPYLDEDDFERIPEETGVYVFRGVSGIALYVGKARNLRERVMAHFYADSSNSNDARLAGEIRSLEFEETPGEFGALIREIQLIRSHEPLHNIALRRRSSVCFVRLAEPDGDAPAIQYVPLADFDPRTAEGLYGPFGSRQAARAALAAIAREHRLCDRSVGLWTGDRACFSRQVGRCLGLCCAEETAQAHHARMLKALAPLAFPDWPFDGPVTHDEVDPQRKLSKRLYFDRWCSYDSNSRDREPFDVEIYKLLRRRLKRSLAGFEPLAAAPD